MTEPLQRIRYLATQSLRLAFFSGQYALTRRKASQSLDDDAQQYVPEKPVPSKIALRRAIFDLMASDLANVEKGLYPPPARLARSPAKLARLARAYFKDLPAAFDRRKRQGGTDIRLERPDLADNDRYPAYYLQNFHYQSGGWLSKESAEIYDYQVEVLFSGTADLMRRHALVPLKERFADYRKSHAKSRPRLLDVGAGTGRFLNDLRRTLPFAKLHAVEPSPAYAKMAARLVSSARISQGFAESLPYDDAFFDGISAVYLFHELPPKIRQGALAEISRALKPGGLFVLMDALQFGDVPNFDGLLEAFPHRFYEPYFESYLTTDFARLAAGVGLHLKDAKPVFLSKLLVFKKD